MRNTSSKEPKNEPVKDKPDAKKRPPLVRWLLWFLAGLIALLAAACSYVYLSSPAAIRMPKLEHAHLRLQLVVDGQVVNFGDAKFQSEKADSASCSADLPTSPIHFHDLKDQYLHLHWKGMTGGLILKNYGWNLIGGPDGTLGYRLDHLPKIHHVPIYGNVLPAMPSDATLWVYTGDEQSFKERATKDFLNQDFEIFFGKKSTVNTGEQTTWLQKLLVPRALAHGSEAHADGDQQELERINNVLGNVVVFIQKDKPTDQQVKDRFDRLEPLTDSTCGG